MSSFTEFLQGWALEEKAKIKANEPVVSEWRAAVYKLIAQIKDWLSEDDPQNLLRITQEEIEKREHGLGFYFIPTMQIRLGSREVEVVPIARIVVSAPADELLDPRNRPQGRVDITDGATHYRVYRLMDGAVSRWVVYEDRHPLRAFDKPAFEDIMVDLLQ